MRNVYLLYNILFGARCDLIFEILGGKMLHRTKPSRSIGANKRIISTALLTQRESSPQPTPNRPADKSPEPVLPGQPQ